MTPSPTTAEMRSSSRMPSLTPSRTQRSSQLSRRQIQGIETRKAESRDEQTSLGVSSRPSPCRASHAQVKFSGEGPYASSNKLRAMRVAGRPLHLRKVLHHLQRPAQRASLL